MGGKVDKFFWHAIVFVLDLEFFGYSLSFFLFQLTSFFIKFCDLLDFLYFLAVLTHDFHVHVFHIVLYFLVVVVDRTDFFLVFFQLELMIVLDGLHVLGVFKVLHQLSFYPVND